MTHLFGLQSPAQKRRAAYWRGFDLHVAEVFDGAIVDLAALTPDERRGYEAACDAEAELEADTAMGVGER